MTDQPVQIRRRMSPSLLGSFDICMKRAQFDMQPDRPRFTSESRMIGTAFHAGLEAHYRERMEHPGVALAVDPEYYYRPALDAFDGDSLAMEEAGTPWDTSRDEAWSKVIGMLTAYFDGGHQWPDEYEVIAVEQKINMPWFDEWSATSVADVVLADPTGWLIVDDHKTAAKRMPDRNKFNPRKHPQGTWYAKWFAEYYQRPVIVTFSIITHAGKFERRVSSPRPEHLTATMERAEQIARLLELGVELPGNPSSTLCNPKWCDHYWVCPHGDVVDTVAA